MSGLTLTSYLTTPLSSSSNGWPGVTSSLPKKQACPRESSHVQLRTCIIRPRRACVISARPVLSWTGVTPAVVCMQICYAGKAL